MAQALEIICHDGSAPSPSIEGCTIPAIIYAEGVYSPTQVIVAGQNRYTQTDPMVIACTSGENGVPCHGISYFYSPPTIDSNGMEWCKNFMRLDGSINIPLSSLIGLPRVAIVSNVRNDSETFNAQCYGYVADFTDNTQKLVIFNNHSLEDYDIILASEPMAGQIFDDIFHFATISINPCYSGGGDCANISYSIPDCIFGGLKGGSSMSATPTINLTSSLNAGIGFAVIGVAGGPPLHSCLLNVDDITIYTEAATT